MDGKKTYSDIVLVNMNINLTTSTKLDIYPNPAHGVVTINLTNLPLYNNALTVTDMAGAIVINKQSLNGSAIKLNVDNLQPGTYMVKVVTAEGIVAQSKIMVTKIR